MKGLAKVKIHRVKRPGQAKGMPQMRILHCLRLSATTLIILYLLLVFV
jgi:hypothetical protein